MPNRLSWTRRRSRATRSRRPRSRRAPEAAKRYHLFFFFWISVGCYHQMMTSLSLAAGWASSYRGAGRWAGGGAQEGRQEGRGCVLRTDGGVEGQVEGEEEEKGIKITCFLFFLDATASRIYFILRNHDENVSYKFLLLMKNKEQAMIPLTCGWFVDLDPIDPLLVTLLLFFFVHVVLWTFPFPNFSISQIYRGLPFF